MNNQIEELEVALKMALKKNSLTLAQAHELLATEGKLFIKHLPMFGTKAFKGLLETAPIVIVTRHQAVVTILAEKGFAGEVISHASLQDVAGKRVYGVLPYRLAAAAASFTEVSLNLPSHLRGVELTLEQVRAHLCGLVTYSVLVIAEEL